MKKDAAAEFSGSLLNAPPLTKFHLKMLYIKVTAEVSASINYSGT